MSAKYLIVHNCSTIHLHFSKSFQLRLHCLSVLEVNPEERGVPFFFFKKLASQSKELTESFNLSYTLEGTPASSCNILFDVHVNFYIVIFLGGLSLHLNHLIGSCVTNYDWQFKTLPFGIFLVKFGHNGP